MNNKIRIGVIGLGWIGSEHARNILRNPDAELYAVCDVNSEKVKKFTKETGASVDYYKDYQKLLELINLDAVVIATPNSTHKDLCVAAAEAKKHIFCEKPLDITLEKCKTIRSAVKKSGVKFLIDYNRRFSPIFQYVKKILNNGDLGNPFYIESDYIHYIPLDLNIWGWIGKKDIGGSIFHAGNGHSVDLMRFFCGNIIEVFAFKDIFHERRKDIQIETEDTVIASFKFENGALGKSFLSLGAISQFRFNFSIYGTKGTVVNNKVRLDWMPKFYDYEHEKDCITLPETWIPDNRQLGQGGISETWDKSINHFIEALKEDKPMLNDIDSAYKTSEVCFAVTISSEERKIINLPL